MATQTASKTCTTLDHIYPKSKFGTPCYCGARVWGKESKGGKGKAGKVTPTPEKVSGETEKVLDTAPAVEVKSQTGPIVAGNFIYVGDKTMEVTLKGKSKNGKRAIYQAGAATFHIPLAAHTNPESPVFGEFKEAKVKTPKVKLTAEERKALRASKPKPTLAEKAAALEAKLAKLRAQAAAENSGAGL